MASDTLILKSCGNTSVQIFSLVLLMGKWKEGRSCKIKFSPTCFELWAYEFGEGSLLLTKYACIRITRWKIGSKSLGRASCSLHGGGTGGSKPQLRKGDGGKQHESDAPKIQFPVP